MSRQLAAFVACHFFFLLLVLFTIFGSIDLRHNNLLKVPGESDFQIAAIGTTEEPDAGNMEHLAALGAPAFLPGQNVWRSYEYYILATVALFVAELLLIALLLRQHRQNRRLITELKCSQAVLRESEERFRLVANTAPVMIWMAGPDKQCVYFNQPWLDFTGRTLEQELGSGWTEGVHPDDLAACLRTYGESFDRREVFTMEYRLRRRDGEYCWMMDQGVPRFHPDGSFAGYIGSCADVTHRRQAEEALAGVSRKLIMAHEEERAWIGRELHDDINQRVAFLGFELDSLRRQLPPEDIETRSRLVESRKHVSELGNDIQSLSHRLHSSKLELLGILGAARSFCQEFAEQQSVKIDFFHDPIPDDLPKEASVCVFRVLQEALHNAAKHSGASHFEVELRATDDEIRLTVSDEGVGFDPGAALKTRGIGLVSMQERLHLVRGKIEIESAPNRGTSIHARVPLRAAV